MTTRHLWIIRHAKSANASPGQGDHGRTLNARGHADGELMRGHFAVQDTQAEWLWVSSAVRAQETSLYVAGGFPDAECSTLDNLYLADPETLLEGVQATPEHVTCVGIIAHNPGLSQLANLLTGGQATDRLPTLGSLLIEFSNCAHWHEVNFGSGRQQQFLTPKSIR